MISCCSSSILVSSALISCCWSFIALSCWGRVLSCSCSPVNWDCKEFNWFCRTSFSGVAVFFFNFLIAFFFADWSLDALDIFVAEWLPESILWAPCNISFSGINGESEGVCLGKFTLIMFLFWIGFGIGAITVFVFLRLGVLLEIAGKTNCLGGSSPLLLLVACFDFLNE